MNQMTSALVQAGVKVPSQSRRIWRFLKDHPDITARRVSQALTIKRGSVTSLLAQMEKRNRVESAAKKAYSSGKMRTIYHWKALGDSYEEPPRRAVTPAVIPTPAKPGLREALVERICPVKPAAAQVVDNLTVAQARELWEILNRMFGGVK